MSAYEIPNLKFAAEAAGAIARRRFIAFDANGKAVQANVGGAGNVVGVSMNSAAAGETIEIADGIVMVEAGAAVTAGAAVEHDGDGKAITLNAGTKAGTALTGAAAAGVLIAVKTI